MDPFKTASKISIPTAIFGFLAMALGWMLAGVSDPITQLQIGESALVFLSLFFYSLVSDKIQEQEERVGSLVKLKKRAKIKPVQKVVR